MTLLGHSPCLKETLFGKREKMAKIDVFFARGSKNRISLWESSHPAQKSGEKFGDCNQISFFGWFNTKFLVKIWLSKMVPFWIKNGFLDFLYIFALSFSRIFQTKNAESWGFLIPDKIPNSYVFWRVFHLLPTEIQKMDIFWF